MSPLLRRLLIAFAVFVLLLGGAAAWLVASFDAERVKALAIDWMKQASISAVAEQLRLSWDEAAGIQERAVRRGLARRQAEPVGSLFGDLELLFDDVFSQHGRLLSGAQRL